MPGKKITKKVTSLVIFAFSLRELCEKKIRDINVVSWNLVQQWSSHAPSIVTIFMKIHAKSEILRDFEFFDKCLW